MGMVLVAPPVDPVVTVAEAKAHLRIDTDNEDALLESYTDVATAHFDGYYGTLRRALKPQTWDWTLDSFPVPLIEIPLLPLISVEEVAYSDPDGLEADIDSESYIVDAALGRVVPIVGYVWPTTLLAARAVRIRFTAGYADIVDSGASDGFRSGVPAPIRHAILLMVGDMYEHRETVAPGGVAAIPMSATVDRLVAPYKRWFIA